MSGGKQNVQLKGAIIEFYRREIELRYQLDNVRRFDAFEDVTNDTITGLRVYFLEHIYPPPEDRKQLDEAFDHLGHLLRSPKQLQPLVGTALTSLWRLGRKLPGAISAGRSTFDAYSETRKLEGYMLTEALKRGYKQAEVEDRLSMLTLIGSIPEKHVLRLIKDITNLFHSLTNIELLSVSHQIMAKCREVMESHPDVYDESERAGISLGIQLLASGLELFKGIDASLFPPIIAGIQQVENDWYDRVREEVAAHSA
jgi:hypothetical protein